MKIALMAIGLPGSGKTTLLKPLAEKYGLVYINRDDIRKELLGDAHGQSRNKEIWQEANRRTAAALSEGKGVVLDSTFLEKWKRKDMIDFLRENGADRIVAVFFNVSPKIAAERNSARELVVPDEGMDWMRQKLADEPPEVTEGFDALYSHEAISDLETLDLSQL
ncbi:MAG TPA: ATP-binding protein [Candidatus Paceibacterota bacterium]